MFDKLKKLKEALTQTSLSDSKSKVKPKTDLERKERFGALTQDQMKRIEESGVSLLSQSKIGEDALKSLNSSGDSISQSPQKEDETSLSSALDNEEGLKEETFELPMSSALESTEFSDVSDEMMSSLSLSLPVVEEKLTNIIEDSEDDISIDITETSQPSIFVHSQAPTEKYPLDPESNMFAQTIATTYSQGDTEGCILQLRNFLNQHKGEVNNKFWYMLLDIYQVINDKSNFEKTALAFAQLFDTSPPSWTENIKSDKKTMMAGKNILILDPNFSMEHVVRFKDFFKAAKQDKFCKINVSQCRFEQSDIEALKEFYKLLVQLRKARIKSFLMGEASLMNFAKTYMNFNPSQKGLKQHFMDNEAFFWNLYLEILQWKGKEEEFDEIALEFADKFEISPNGWENEGVMSFDLNEDGLNDDTPQLDNVINNNNISVIQEIIKHDFSKMNKAELDFTFVDRVDFSTCGGISFMIRELLSKPENANKEIFLIRPNEMILTLFDMLGTTDCFKVVHKKR